MRVGIGYDVHRLVSGRPLVLGGVTVPFHLGLEGHSDADVLIHAICDALLGAAGEGDIGKHFPPEDDRYLGISSLKLLAEVKRIISRRFTVANIDSVVVAQEPKLAPHIEAMRAILSGCLELDPEAVSVKATTTEGLGAEGESRAMSAYAVALLRDRQGDGSFV